MRLLRGSTLHQSPGPGAYTPRDPLKAETACIHSSASSAKLGEYDSKSGGMSGTAAGPLKPSTWRLSGPGPAAHSPRVDRNGKPLLSGSDSPSWYLAGKPSPKKFISKAHSAIDNTGSSGGPGPGAYSPRQVTARGEREKYRP